MINLDSLVEKVMAQLAKRQHQQYDCTYQATVSVPDTQIFLDYATVVITNVSIELLTALYRLDTDNVWVAWILQGIDYQVTFQLSLNELAVHFIPRKMLLDWPILFITNRHQLVQALAHRVVTRQDLAAMPDKSLVVVTRDQHLTAEATDLLAAKDMKLQTRTDEDCIWQK
ncbi:PduM family microcompartment protein [Levilactobacillus namurensis]|uniref:PduM family microcompartment protein n=1 Tax=Levilactobacillus namurensis TaxID=380393 RepID=UPI000A69A2AD|nr:PduM family microcompartment protein [Levilactobacillus namurensis]